MRTMNNASLLVLLHMVAILALAGTAIAKDPVINNPSDETAQPATSNQPVHGPILAQDPATRALIKDLYLEQNILRQTTMDQLRTLNQSYASEVSDGIRQELSSEMRTLKVTHEIRNIEIGLEIAQLNGQQQRVAEYELALDQVQNPEKYWPTDRPDPAIKAARIRKQGQK